MVIDRRTFLVRTLAATGGAALGAAGLDGLIRIALAGPGRPPRAGLGDGGYGPLREAGPELALPDGFVYRVLGAEGAPMSDGNPTPRAHDGMAAFPLPNGNIRLIRNHEVRDGPDRARAMGDPAAAYDPAAPAGCVSLEVEPDGDREPVRDYVSLNGTYVNCAGGPTPWGSWLSCEETVAGRSHGWTRPHGYVFDVAVTAEGPVEPVPIVPLGRFVHEAVAVDPATGIVYQTEDQRRSGFYRFLPDRRDDLLAGGRLEMLAIADRPNFDAQGQGALGEPLPVRWAEIPDPDPAEAERDASAVFDQGYERGGARFSRLEGAWFGDGAVYFVATDGGRARCGQVWVYRPGADGGTLTLWFESPGRDVLDGPDNICVTPRGGILLCEDGRGVQYLRGVTPDGRVFDFGRNLAHDGEFAGTTFSPDGRTLFANIQGDTRSGGADRPGMTLAIWGPWEEGAL